MKKLSGIFLILVVLSVLLAACGEAAPEKTEPSLQVEVMKPFSGKFSPEDFMNEIQIHLTALYECEAETFFTEIMYDTSYLAAGHWEGENFVADTLYEEGTKAPEGYEIDPSYSSYYVARHLATIADVRKNLCFYLSEDLVDHYLDPEEFFETPQTLYIRRGARGYGSILPDVNSARYLGQEGQEQLVAVDYQFFGEYDFTATLHFIRTDSSWKLIQVESPYLG